MSDDQNTAANLNTRELRDLIAASETLAVEFKGESHAPLSDRELIEAVVCLANSGHHNPSWLLIGVEDDGSVTGARPRHDGGQTQVQRVQALVTNRTRPSLITMAELVKINRQEVLVIQIPPVRGPVGTSDGQYFRRIIGGRGRPECVPFYFQDMVGMQADQGLLDYSALTVPDAIWEDLDPLEFERFRKSIRNAQGLGDTSLVNLSDLELAKALGVVEANHLVRAVKIAGLLLFGKETAIQRFLPLPEAAFQQLAGLQVEANEFFRLPLLRLVEQYLARFQARYREDEVLVGMLRVGVPDYPERAFREAIANALVHRDYTRLGAVHVQWHADRIEISNPGGFPQGVHLNNLLTTPPRPRNPLLADAFKRAGIVERTGRGIDTIFYEQLRNGRPAPEYGRSTNTDVVLVLPGGKANLDFARLVVEENQAGRSLGVDELLVLNGLWLERQLDTPQVAHLIQKPEQDARRVLSALIEAGLVEARGVRGGRHYHFSAPTYRRLGQKAAYIRQHGFEPLQQESMLLQYARKYGRIARKDAADLCKITDRQASYLLNKMVRSGKLLAAGRQRGRYYTLPEE